MALPTIGWIGLGDQGAPMARAIAEAGYPLHVWARRTASLRELDGLPYAAVDTPAVLGRMSDIIGLCLREDHDIRQVLTDDRLLASMRPGSILVNHGTGLPAFAQEINTLVQPYGVRVLDAPVSGGRAGAVAKQLTTIVGGDPQVLEEVRPVFETFSKTIVHLGGPGAGQVGKLINNTLLMANQQNLADLLAIGVELGAELKPLVEVLRSGTGSSTALQALGTAITPANAEHLSRLQLIDMDLFGEAVSGLKDAADEVNRRAVRGAQALPTLADMVR